MNTTRGGRGHGSAREIIHDVFQKGVGFWHMDGDHMEFPFSEAGRYPKKTLAEACVSSPTFQEEKDEEDEEVQDNEFLSFAGVAGSAIRGVTKLPHSLLKASISQPVKSTPNCSDLDKTNQKNTCDPPPTAIPDNVWKRVTDPKGLPEQNITITVKSRKTIKEEILHNKGLMHKASKRMFDDRLFIVDKTESITGNALGIGAITEETLNQLIGTNNLKNPVMSLVAEYGAPALEMLKIGLSVWRAGFNLFTWRDPFLTFIFFVGAILLLFVLLVFPWRLFFFVMGLGAVGPQNWLLRVQGKLPPNKKKNKKASGETKNESKKNGASSFQFHNHLATDAGIDVRDKRNKSTSGVRRAVVPNSPLISRRFYDWPPNPSVSTVDVYTSKEKPSQDGLDPQ